MTARDPKGNVRSRPREAGTIVPSTVQTPPHVSVPPSLFVEEHNRNVAVMLQRLCEITGGYLKLRRPGDGAAIHLTWTWTLGPHASKYVYVQYNYWEIELALSTLLYKIVDVEEGRRKPSPDRYLA